MGTPRTLLVIAGFGLLATVALTSVATAEARAERWSGVGQRVEAQRVAVRTVGGPDGPAWNLWSNGHIEHPVRFDRDGHYRVSVRARGNADRLTEPQMELRIDGRPVGSVAVHVDRQWRFRTYSFDVAVDRGRHDVALAFVNDPNRPGDNVDLVIDWFAVSSIPGRETTTTRPGPVIVTTASNITTSTTSTSAPTTLSSSVTTTTPTSPSTPSTTMTAPPSTRPPSPSRSPHVPPGYRLSWSDEFDSLSLDLGADGGERWATKFIGWNVLSLAGNGDQCMKADPDHTGTGGPRLGLETHRVDRGVLTLFGRPIPQGQRSQFWGYEAACGMISGQRSHTQTYGYWETRMRIANVSRGHHWAIWLVPGDDSWPPEVDILEVVGTNSARNADERRFHFTGHYLDGGGTRQADMAYRNAPGPADGWYTLGLEWTADSVVWHLDGVEVHRMWNFVGDKPVYFMISPEIGGNWPGPTSQQTTWPMAMDVDYVRIYSK